MIKDNQSFFNRVQILLDGIVVAGTYLAAWFLKFESGLLPYDPGLPASTYFLALCVILPGYLVLYQQFGLYNAKRASGNKKEFLNIIKANTIGLLAFMVALFIVNQPDFSRQMIFIFWTLNICVETAMRNVIRLVLEFFRKRGYNVKYVLLVGYSRSTEQYIDRIRQNPQWGYVVRGILDNRVERGSMYKGIKVLGPIENLSIILPENKLDEIAITLSLSEYGKLPQIVDQCEKSGVHTKFIPDYTGFIPNKPYTEDLQGLPVINIRHVPLTNTMNALIKRTVDVIGSFFGIVILSPLMLVVAILVKCTSRGPVIFAQDRIGLHNKMFKMYKFRTMYVQRPEDEVKGWSVKDDPRVTKIGKVLRKSSIDELPQLFNTLLGQMSLIGPRPERPAFVKKFQEEIPRYMVKHQVRPGMTGWAQVNGLRGDTSIERRIEYDLYYIENWTIMFDIKILFMTIFRGFYNKSE